MGHDTYEGYLRFCGNMFEALSTIGESPLAGFVVSTEQPSHVRGREVGTYRNTFPPGQGVEQDWIKPSSPLSSTGWFKRLRVQSGT